MSAYNELKARIEALDNGWTKEADDILQEISKKLPEEINGIYCKEMGLLVKVTTYNSEYVVFQARNSGNYGKDISPIFNYHSQCEKLTAFKQALTWLLDHSDIKKDEKQDKIKELKTKMASLQEELKELRQ